MTAQEMLEQAIIELGNLNDGEVFIVKDLFKGHIWNAQDRAERLTLGTLFMNYVRQNQDKLQALSKNSSGQQEYRLVNGWTFKPLSQKNCFIKTGVMEMKIIEEGMIFVSIGTSGLDLCEMALKSGADVEKLASVLNQTLID
ncbi:MAG: single-stranded DNA-binding protein [Lachnospiraceae bacterium]|nr:single-stranded DNA-binding protein [Lachnospiraceae bacterium]